MNRFSQLEITMFANRASMDQFQRMRILIIKLARTSKTKTIMDVIRYTTMLMNQECGKKEAIHKMKYFLKG